MANSYGVSCRDVHKAFGAKVVLDGLTLQIPAGAVYALLGANGAGKTTLVRILATLLQPDAGHVEVAGIDVRRDPRAVHRAISLTGQFAAVDDQLTARENLAMFAALLGVPKAVVADQLARFGLAADADRLVSTYSGGMRRRLDLAVSLLRVPQVLFLDEPTTGLDSHARRDLWDAVKGLAAQGVTVLLTTQYLEEADALADRVGVLHGGRLVAEGSPTQLKSSAGDDRVTLVDGSGAAVAERCTDGTAADVRRALAELDAVAHGSDLHVEVHRPTLEDVVSRLTAAEAAR